MNSVYVGIDLGTTYSAVASFSREEGRVRVYKNSDGKDCTPSVMCFSDNDIIIGDEAKDEQKSGNVDTVAFYKSMMGDPNWSAYLKGREYTAEQLSGIFLKKLVSDIERENGISIKGAVITVPAYFNERQREATINAGKQAGLEVLKIINEPTAAIIAYGLTSGKEKNVMVYDLGGGTFDVTIAKVNGTSIDVLATNGNHQLGGKDWDNTLLDEIKDRFFVENGIDVSNYPEDLKTLQVNCEEAKKRLSAVSSTQITVFCDGISGKYEIKKEDFDDLTYSLLYETILLINNCFEEITESQGQTFGWSNIDEVVLVGGSTRMPQVKDMILKEYGKPPITREINVDTIVATGAAMQAELCRNKTLVLTLAKKPEGNGQNDQKTMSLVISNDDIQDITAHGLGMLALSSDEKEYINSIIIPKNSKVNKPFSRKYKFGGDTLKVYVLQGESRDPNDCDLIGEYSITGMPAGTDNNITVNFLYNSNGVVDINARLADGRELSADREGEKEELPEIITRLEREKAEAEEARRRSCVEIMLMIDTSGSMSGRSIEKARESAENFVRGFDLRNTYISIISFADKSVFKCRMTNDSNEIYSAIQSIQVGEVGMGTGDTPIEDNYRQFTGQHPKVMVVLTDGEWFEKEREERSAAKAKADGVIIYGIGIGDADETFLGTISSGAGKKVDLNSLTSAFKEVASSIATEVSGSTLK